MCILKLLPIISFLDNGFFVNPILVREYFSVEKSSIGLPL